MTRISSKLSKWLLNFQYISREFYILANDSSTYPETLGTNVVSLGRFTIPRKRLSYRRHVRFHSRIGRNNKSRLSWGQLEVTRTNQRHVAITELRHKLARELPRRPGSPTKILWLPRVTPVSRHRSLPRDPRRSSTFHTSIHSSGYRPDPCRFLVPFSPPNFVFETY